MLTYFCPCSDFTHIGVMAQSRRFYIAGFGTVVFVILLLLLERTILPSELRPSAIIPASWPKNLNSSKHEGSDGNT